MNNWFRETRSAPRPFYIHLTTDGPSAQHFVNLYRSWSVPWQKCTDPRIEHKNGNENENLLDILSRPAIKIGKFLFKTPNCLRRRNYFLRMIFSVEMWIQFRNSWRILYWKSNRDHSIFDTFENAMVEMSVLHSATRAYA